jgi:hypothetical protein
MDHGVDCQEIGISRIDWEIAKINSTTTLVNG